MVFLVVKQLIEKQTVDVQLLYRRKVATLQTFKVTTLHAVVRLCEAAFDAGEREAEDVPRAVGGGWRVVGAVRAAGGAVGVAVLLHAAHGFAVVETARRRIYAADAGAVVRLMAVRPPSAKPRRPVEDSERKSEGLRTSVASLGARFSLVAATLADFGSMNPTLGNRFLTSDLQAYDVPYLLPGYAIERALLRDGRLHGGWRVLEVGREPDLPPLSLQRASVTAPPPARSSRPRGSSSSSSSTRGSSRGSTLAISSAVLYTPLQGFVLLQAVSGAIAAHARSRSVLDDLFASNPGLVCRLRDFDICAFQPDIKRVATAEWEVAAAAAAADLGARSFFSFSDAVEVVCQNLETRPWSACPLHDGWEVTDVHRWGGSGSRATGGAFQAPARIVNAFFHHRLHGLVRIMTPYRSRPHSAAAYTERAVKELLHSNPALLMPLPPPPPPGPRPPRSPAPPSGRAATPSPRRTAWAASGPPS